MKKLPQGEALRDLAESLGIPTFEFEGGRASRKFPVEDAELQRRIMEYRRSRRESRLWIIAVVSAAASVLSAAAAFIAVCIGRG